MPRSDTLPAAPRFTGEAPVEVHTLLSHQHVERCLVALRSLARFWTAPAVVLHDDGTLDADDHVRLRALGAARVVSRAEADAQVEQTLANFPLVLRTRRGNPRIMQLVDYFVLAGRPRVIGMDSDVVFLNRPDRLIDWANGAEATALLYSPEHGWQPKGIHWLPDAVPGRPFVDDMCCGFVAADAATFFDAAYLEELMQRTDPDILPRPRFVTQMLYSLMAGRLSPELVRDLGEPYRSGRLEWLPELPERVICHYFGSHDGEDYLSTLTAADPGLRQPSTEEPAS
ncbi:hypothetical protein AQJ30_08965 [Streptomyces longwoodensis]|uniref:Glycosyltransferase n=1 Tax=Streptomyces longwoodensis TaxID=68231 RepID=A0A101R152_9ACTN|nr:hypothetical protein [Streptomyces longwoodensis]KUN39782.1 hypothetical protein AQJ30_08965 [Streptomyces longwoodensis]